MCVEFNSHLTHFVHLYNDYSNQDAELLYHHKDILLLHHNGHIHPAHHG